MNSFILILHSWLRWLILIAALWTVIRAIGGMAGHKRYTKADNRSSLFFQIFMDLQLLVGILTYLLRGWTQRWSDPAALMSNSAARFLAMEHVVLMVIAFVLVHVGRKSVKKANIDRKKHSRALLFFGLALLLILAAIPWPFRADLGFHPWFRFAG